jgi:hypothetical protein
MRVFVMLGLLAAVACDEASRSDTPAAREQPRSTVVVMASTTIAAPVRSPLRDWMSADMMHRLKREDFGALEAAFQELRQVEPPGMERWARFATAGVGAAHAHDLQAVRTVCASCHQAYRAAYRTTMRARAIPMREEP